MSGIGEYIELNRYALQMFYKSAAALDCNRNGFAFLIRAICGTKWAEMKKYLVDMGFMSAGVAEDCCKLLERIQYGCAPGSVEIEYAIPHTLSREEDA